MGGHKRYVDSKHCGEGKLGTEICIRYKQNDKKRK